MGSIPIICTLSRHIFGSDPSMLLLSTYLYTPLMLNTTDHSTDLSSATSPNARIITANEFLLIENAILTSVNKIPRLHRKCTEDFLLIQLHL